MKSWFTRVGVCLLALCLVPAWTAAQTQTGGVTGVVIDATQATVPQARVVLKSKGTGAERTVMTNDQGIFLFDKVWPGEYVLTISKDGFKSAEFDNLVLRVGSISNLGTIMMEVGDVGDTIQVDAASVPMLETQSAQITGTVPAKQVLALQQLRGGLDQLALLTPGVVPGFGNINSNGMQVAANGQRSRSTQFMMDGHQMNDITIGGPSVFVTNLDMIQEYQVVTNQFSAEFGRNLGATVNIITRGGTNEHHGSLFWQHHNSALNSRTSLQRRNNLTKPNLINNIWGVTAGGPVIREKLFYYGSYQGRKQPGGTTSIGTSSVRALTPAGVQTLLTAFPSSVPLQIYRDHGPFARPDGNPKCVEATRTTLTLAGVAGVEACGIERFVPLNTEDKEYSGRADMKLGRHQLFGRYMYQSSEFCCSGGQDGYWIDVPNRNDTVGITYTVELTPTQVNTFKFNWGRFLVAFEGGNTFPISSVRSNLTRITMPSGFLSFGLATNLPQNRLLNTYQVSNQWSLVKGRHFIKAGVEFHRNLTTLFFLPSINGAFTFDQTNLSDFVANTPASVTFAAGEASFDPTETDQFYYFQDDWRIRPNLTLNLGLRYEHNGQPINRAVDEVLARESDPSQAFWLQSVPIADRTLARIPNDNNNVAPRIGLAWTPRFGGWFLGDGKTTWRGGYGVAYELAFYNILLNVTTAAPRVFLFGLSRAAGTAVPIPSGGSGEAVAGSIPVPTNSVDPRTLAQTIMANNFRNPYSQNWSFGFQREIGRSQVLEVRYVGTNGIGLFQSINKNPLFTSQFAAFPETVPSGVSPCTTAGQPGTGRVNCNRAAVRERGNTGWSNYNSLQVRYDVRNFANQLTGGVSFAWSKGIDTVSEIFGFFGDGSVAFSQNPFDFTRGERGRSNQVLEKTLVFNYIWELPWMRSQQGVLGKIVGGWQVSGVTTLLSGRPWTPILFPSTSGASCSQDVPFNSNFVGLLTTCRPFLANPSAPLRVGGVPNVGYVQADGTIRRGSNTGPTVGISDVHFLNNTPNAINLITGRPFGIGRNNYEGDGTHQWDINIQKRVRITETIYMRYAMAMINAFNHHNFGVPQIRADLSTFADITQNNVAGRNIRMGLWLHY